MRTKLVGIILLWIVIPSVALFANDTPNGTNAPRGVTRASVADAENPNLTVAPPNPSVTASEQRLTPQDYEAAMVAVTQNFSAMLAAIAEAVQQGKLSSEQGKALSAEQYQLAQMQFELLSLWREIEETDLARIPDAPPSPATTQENEIVTVAPPFSSLELTPSLVHYLSLTPSQLEAIQQVMASERQSLQPLIEQIRVTGEKLVAISNDQTNAREVKGLAEVQAALVAKLILANTRMQSKIYKVLNPDQRKKLSGLERTRGAAVNEGHQNQYPQKSTLRD